MIRSALFPISPPRPPLRSRPKRVAKAKDSEHMPLMGSKKVTGATVQVQKKPSQASSALFGSAVPERKFDAGVKGRRKVLSTLDSNRSGSKRKGCPQPVVSSSLKRAAMNEPKDSELPVPCALSKTSKNVTVGASGISNQSSKSCARPTRRIVANYVKSDDKNKNQAQPSSSIPSDAGTANHSPDAVKFSDEWFAAIEAAGEEILTKKGGAVQNSPANKSPPQLGPYSPVKRKHRVIGPFDCTKYSVEV